MLNLDKKDMEKASKILSKMVLSQLSLAERLGDATEEELQQLEIIHQLEEKRLSEGKQEGLIEGKQEGLIEGKQEGLIEGNLHMRRAIGQILSVRFGSDLESYDAQLAQLTLTDLEGLTEVALKVDEEGDFATAVEQMLTQKM